MTEYSRMAKGFFTSTGFAKVINLPFQPDYVEFTNYTLSNSAATSQNVVHAEWDVNMGQGFAVIQGYNATPALIYDVVSTNGISTFSGGLQFQYGPVVSHANGQDFAIAKASSAVITQTAHGLQTGDVIVFSNLAQTSTTGMNQIAGIPFMVTRTNANTFTINWDTTGLNYAIFNTATSTNNVGSYKKVLFPDLYFPGELVVTGFSASITDSTKTVISTNVQHNYQVGQEVAFRIPAVWGPTQFNSLPNNVIPGSPIYGYVISVQDMQNFTVNIDSTGFTAFNANQPFLGARSLPQVIAAGDVNTGGVQISANSPLYPSPQYSFAALNDSSTINGPAIVGSFVNNTRQGFIIGNGAGRVLTTASLVGAAGNVIYWRAFFHDMSIPR